MVTVALTLAGGLLGAFKSVYTDLNINIQTKAEVKAPGSVPDLVVYRKENRAILYVITFEFKLSDWRRALGQAFRHRNFGNEAYVVLDYARSRAARENLDYFIKSNVGLATVNTNDEIRIWYFPQPALPFSSEFSAAFSRSLLSRKTTPLKLPYIRSLKGGAAIASLKTVLTGGVD